MLCYGEKRVYNRLWGCHIITEEEWGVRDERDEDY